MNIFATSDNHGRLPKLPAYVLATRIDLMILAGDITPNDVKNWDMSRWNDRRCNVPKESASQKAWMNDTLIPWTKKFKGVENIVFVNGNHDFFDSTEIEGIIALKTGSKVITVNGMKIGLLAGSMNYKGEWHDESDEYEMKQRINALDRDIKMLISHVPPFGIRDQAYGGDRIGCKGLREAILGHSSAFEPEQMLVSPHFENLRHHFYGHVHEQRGSETQEVDGRQVTFHNLSETWEAFSIEDDDAQSSGSKGEQSPRQRLGEETQLPKDDPS